LRTVKRETSSANVASTRSLARFLVVNVFASRRPLHKNNNSNKNKKRQTKKIIMQINK